MPPAGAALLQALCGKQQSRRHQQQQSFINVRKVCLSMSVQPPAAAAQVVSCFIHEHLSYSGCPCSLPAPGLQHDWRACPFAHPTENARRRDPREFKYSSLVCPDYRQGCCVRGDTCQYAHGKGRCRLWVCPADACDLQTLVHAVWLRHLLLQVRLPVQQLQHGSWSSAVAS